MIEKLKNFGVKVILFLLVCLIGGALGAGKDIFQKKIRDEYTGKNEIVLNIAKNAPFPNRNIYGMSQVVNDENLYVEFFEDVKVDNNSNSVLCDYADKDLKNELKVIVLRFSESQVSKEETFSNMTVSQMEEYINQIKNPQKTEYRPQNIKFVDGSYFKVNGNVVIYFVFKDNSQPDQTIFQYHVAKNRKIYILSYITLDSINNQPNDVILTSLNTLRIK